MDFFISVLAFVVAAASIALLALLILWPFYAFYKAAKVAEPILPKQNGSDVDSPNEIGLQDWENGDELRPREMAKKEKTNLLLNETERFHSNNWIFSEDASPMFELPNTPKKSR